MKHSNVISLYSLKDSKTGSFGPTFEQPGDDSAVRYIRGVIINEPRNFVALFPGDYQLFRIGTLDRDSGVVSSNLDLIADVSTLDQPGLFSEPRLVSSSS